MGVAYLAHDIELDRRVALKLPHFSGPKHEKRLAAGEHVVCFDYYELGAGAIFLGYTPLIA